jgi:hypothetical protein
MIVSFGCSRSMIREVSSMRERWRTSKQICSIDSTVICLRSI